MRVINAGILHEAYEVNREVTSLNKSLTILRQNEKYNIERANVLIARSNKWFSYIVKNNEPQSWESFAESGNRCVAQAIAHREAAIECADNARTIEDRIDTITGNVLYFVTDAEEEEWAKLN